MSKKDYGILLVEDEDHMVTAMEVLLGSVYSLRVARTASEAIREIEDNPPDLVLLDLGLPDRPGTDVMKAAREHGLDIDFIVVTASKSVDAAVQVMKLGARDYVQKPFEKEDLLLCLENAQENRRLKQEVSRLRSELYQPFHLEGIVAESPAMRDVLALAMKMSGSESTVLITGESGTGKELVAHAIHCEGTRSQGPFVAVNCAQFTASLLESELFGHEKGAFTGAAETRKGRFELANGGTLFLDEIKDSSLEMQAKILRAVETRQFERVGGQETLATDIRLIAATNADLAEAVRRGEFREDLYYRLNVVGIHIPPLRDRREDIQPLCEYFLAKHCEKTGRHMTGITPQAMAALKQHEWRGNVRELQNLIEMTVALEDEDWITTKYLPGHVVASTGKGDESCQGGHIGLETVVQDFEKRFLSEQLHIHDWNRSKTARALGVHRNTIDNKMKKYGLSAGRPDLQ